MVKKLRRGKIILEYLPFYQLPEIRYESGLDDFILKIELRERLTKILSTLTLKEEKVLRLRFGLKDGKEYTLEEIGRILRFTRERIRQIESKALRKLKHPDRLILLKEFY